MTDFRLPDAPRLLVEATLAPVQGERFQPTGFPDLGPATYSLPDGTPMLLVESAQSMANRLEAACWDEGKRTLVDPLAGLPYVQVDVFDGGEMVASTSSVLEAHRLNSPYVLQGKDGATEFESTFMAAAGFSEGRPVDRHKFCSAAFRFDPSSLLHGLFMSNIKDGRMRLARAVSAFIEARGAESVASGGVKNDRINPSGAAKEGFGNVPFARTEFAAGSLVLFFSLDLDQIRGYGLPDEGQRLLFGLALFKLQRLLSGGLRLRTACDLAVRSVRVTAPGGYELPGLSDLSGAMPGAIAAARSLFADPPVTRLRFGVTEASSQKSKKATRAAKGEEKTS